MTVSVVESKLRVWIDPLSLFVHIPLIGAEADVVANPYFSRSLQVSSLVGALCCAQSLIICSDHAVVCAICADLPR